MQNFYTKIFILSLILIFLYTPFSLIFSAEADKILLNGTWQGIKGKGIAELPAEGFYDLQVPGEYFSDGTGGAAYMWIMRQINIPESWHNKRIFVKFNMCSYDPHVYIDGELIAQRLEGWVPFEVEITSAVRAGSTHWLQLRCQDRSATFADGFQLQPNQAPEAISGKILAPVGGGNFFGPMDDVWLYSRPNIYLDDIEIIPSTRKNTLTVSGIISDPTTDSVSVEGKVLDKDETVLEIPPSSVNGTEWEISASFPDAKYWSPETPHLYKLQLTLRKDKSGEIMETSEERFGFKEFWIEGPDFYLNGVKRHLLASSTWPSARVDSPEQVRKKLESIKAANTTTFRYHTQPWPKRWVDIADEVGVMIIDEAAVYTDRFGMYAYNDERFWENYRKHLERFIKRDRNNASLIMWSIENELLFMGMTRYDQNLPKKLGDLGRFVKELDPYHPITYEGDLDPDGASDVLGLHYPHELPTHTDWPNTADWLSERVQTEAGGGMLGMTRRDFYWDKTKPLYIGEYLWTPQEDYSTGTIFFGDKAYTDKNLYHNKGKLQAWFDQTVAYRRFGVSGICPWSAFGHGVIIDEPSRPFYEIQTELFRPVAAFLRNRDTRFFCGDIVERTFDVFNDTVSDVNLTLKWNLSDTDISGEEKFELEAGGYKKVNINFTAPSVSNPTPFGFYFELFANGEQINKMQEKYTVTKRQPITAPLDAKVLLYDPQNDFHKNIPWAEAIVSLEDLNKINVDDSLLIIAPQITGTDEVVSDTLIGQTSFDSADFLAFLKKGGRAIVLEQNTLSGFGLGMVLAEKASTMTFAINTEHPVLAGLSEDDLKFWRGDNYVTSYEIVRPTVYGTRAITVSGSSMNLNHTPILEVAAEKGSVLFIQALVGEKLDIEPAARKIFQNSINYMAAKKPNMSNVVVFSDDKNFTNAISTMELKYVQTDNLVKDKKLDNTDILILNGVGEKIIKANEKIADFINASPSKTIYWHCPDETTFDALKAL
ncbi:MAG: glycoside hydrolase family 2 TIM barrel-domain containing protein, partial [Candidatus Ratteibacteria bacterium]|nr:glycoside hydrolase family 2 TIM barrel-domain containing protein [Candidatus Ratteibacteria bacterium]